MNILLYLGILTDHDFSLHQKLIEEGMDANPVQKYWQFNFFPAWTLTLGHQSPGLYFYLTGDFLQLTKR